MVNHVESDRSTDLVWRERDGPSPNNMYKNRKCKEKYKQILVGIEEKPDSMLAGSSTKSLCRCMCVCWTLLANDHVEFFFLNQPPCPPTCDTLKSQRWGNRKWFSRTSQGNTSIIIVGFLLLGLNILKKKRTKTSKDGDVTGEQRPQ